MPSPSKFQVSFFPSASLGDLSAFAVENSSRTIRGDKEAADPGKLIDDALEAVEKEKPKLKNILNKNCIQLQIDPANLAGLIDLIATHPFQYADLHPKDILGHIDFPLSMERSDLDGAERRPKVYTGGLNQFALAAGKKGGRYFTPKLIVSLIVEMIEPYQGRVYDPAMGSGGFIQSKRVSQDPKTGHLALPA